MINRFSIWVSKLLIFMKLVGGYSTAYENFKIFYRSQFGVIE